ncbi:MAG TPA: roadblock/LC7 domain-containing protein [Streptosporangiaceae bacterium]|nr:roadblock/LC7 domain-containing protein [Streptosporangiaceae bacterium]
MEPPATPATMDWVVDDLVRRVEGVSQAVVLSRDGLTLGASQGLSREDADHFCAVAAGLQSLAREAAQRFGAGQVRQTIVEMEAALVFAIEAGDGTCLAAVCPADAKPGLIAYEMGKLVKRIRQHLAADPRPAESAGVPEAPPG